MPSKLFANPRSQRLCNRFFSGKAARKMGDRIFVFETVLLLFWSEKTVEKVLAVPLKTLADPLNFYDVVAKTLHVSFLRHRMGNAPLHPAHCRKSFGLTLYVLQKALSHQSSLLDSRRRH